MNRLIQLVLLFLSYAANCKVEAQCAKPNISPTGVVNGSEISNFIQLRCQYTGATQSTQFKWILNSMPVDGLSSFFWVLTPPLPEGVINCGYDDCTVLSDPVTVITPPMIEFLSANTTVDIGADISLNCEAAGYPEPNIAWYFGDEIIGFASELNIVSLDESKDGKYTCLAHNEAGYVTSVTWITLNGSTDVSSEIPVLTSSSSNILMSATLTVVTLSTTGSTNNPTTDATNDPSTVNGISTMFIIIMTVSVLVFTVLLLTLMMTIYWCQHKGTRNREGNHTDVDRMTIPTSTSYINASFKDDEYNIYINEEEMKVELFATDSEGGEVLSAHAYKVQNANLYDSSDGSKEGVSSTKIPIKKQDDVQEHVIDPNQVADSLLEITTSLNHETSENDAKECLNEGESLEEEGFEGNPMAEVVEKKVKNDPIRDLENLVHNPHWLSEMKDQNRSHVLSANELVNMVHTLDLMSVEKSKSVHPCRKEFETSPMKFPSSDDWPRETMSKNRYRDIVPTPDTAVTLANKGDDLHSTYINANFIKGFDGYPKAYISSQAPVYDTVPDFWQMVWEQKVDAIVMLTGIFEGGKNKCAKYWPSSQDNYTQVYGKYTIQNVHEESFQNYKLIFLSVSCADNPTEERDVYHYHFLGWPDFGVPTDGYSIMQLRSSVESIRHPESTLLVHCSAGIGRTGTYIGIDIAIRQYEKDGVVDPLLILQLMRKDRGGMIQTLEQYEFLHRALSVYVLQNMK